MSDAARPAVAADPPGERETDALVDQIEDEVRRWPTSAQAIRQYVLPLLVQLRAALPAVAADPPGEREPELLEAGRHLDADALPEDLAALRGRFYVSSDRTADAFDAALAEIVRLRTAVVPANG